MAELNIRRLKDIKPEHVSLVNAAANMRKFIIIKNKEGVEQMDEVLKNIEKALNDIDTRLVKIEEGNTKVEIEKVGARFSKSTLSQLKALHESLGKLLGDNKKDEEEDGKKEEVKPEEARKAIEKGMLFELEKKDEKK